MVLIIHGVDYLVQDQLMNLKRFWHQISVVKSYTSNNSSPWHDSKTGDCRRRLAANTYRWAAHWKAVILLDGVCRTILISETQLRAQSSFNQTKPAGGLRFDRTPGCGVDATAHCFRPSPQCDRFPTLIPAFWNLLTVSLLNFLQKRSRHYIRLTLAHYLPPSASHTHTHTHTNTEHLLDEFCLRLSSKLDHIHARTHLNYTVDVISGRNYIFKAHCWVYLH